jgi:hypothetical protein
MAPTNLDKLRILADTGSNESIKTSAVIAYKAFESRNIPCFSFHMGIIVACISILEGVEEGGTFKQLHDTMIVEAQGEVTACPE